MTSSHSCSLALRGDSAASTVFLCVSRVAQHRVAAWAHVPPLHVQKELRNAAESEQDGERRAACSVRERGAGATLDAVGYSNVMYGGAGRALAQQGRAASVGICARWHRNEAQFAAVVRNVKECAAAARVDVW